MIILSLNAIAFQGFSIHNFTPMEAAGVLYCWEQRMGKAIPEKDLTAGKLGQYLKPEDYNPIKQVSNFSSTLLLVLIVTGLFPGSVGPSLSPSPVPPLPPVLLVHSLYSNFLIFKNMSILVKGQTTTDQFMQISLILVPRVLAGGFYAFFPARHTTVVRRAFRASCPSYVRHTTGSWIYIFTCILLLTDLGGQRGEYWDDFESSGTAQC